MGNEAVETLVLQSLREMIAEDWAKAVQSASLAAQMDATDPDAWFALAEALSGWKQPDKALPAVEQALGLCPGRGRYHKAHGRILLALERVEEGLAALKRAMECDPDLAEDYAGALIQHERYSEARAILAGMRAKLAEGEDRLAVDYLESTLLLNEALDAHWTLVGEGQDAGYLPLSYAALAAMDTVINQVRGIGRSREIDERLEKLEGVVAENRSRRYAGGVGVPVGMFLVGVITTFVGVKIHDGGTIAAGVAYLACSGIYFHAARAPVWKVNVRRAKGEQGADAGFADELARTKDLTEGAGAILGGLCCFGFFGPVVVGYHYVRNYLMD